MSAATLGTLVVIALIDSTSIGTLVIPIWLLLEPRRRWTNVMVYLATLSVFYFVVGLVLISGARVVLDAVVAQLSEFFTSPTGGALLLVLGAGLIVVGVLTDPRRRKTGSAPPRTARLEAARSDPAMTATIALALTAGTLEVATMLPYLAALAIIATLGTLTLQMTVLAGYVVVMAAPALVLLACRQIVGERVTASLERLRAWLTKHSASAASILLIVIGINLALNGITTVTGTR